MSVNSSITDLAIIIPPAGPKNSNYPPYGALYIAGALKEAGYQTEIVNVDTERYTNQEVVEKIRKLNPTYIGFSGIVAPSYKYIKDISFDFRKAFANKVQILGGGLASAAEAVLKNTSINIIVRGEGDRTIVELMDCLKKGGDLKNVPGICYKEGSKIAYSVDRRLIMNLDSLPYPAFDLIDMDKYLPNGAEFIQGFTRGIDDKRIYRLKKSGKRKMISFMTSRGCFGRCAFCFRAYPGLRMYSIDYIFNFIDYCIEKFNVGFITFADECFAPNKKRNWEFIEEFKKRKPDIVFRILGMRVDTVDKEILKAYKEIGCWMIEYGFESGSQKMLNIISKDVTVEDNRCAALWSKEAGIFTMPTAVLGMPGETNETIQETINFLKSLSLDFKQFQWSYALPIPGSQLYDFAKLTGAIDDDDKYLSSLVGPVGHAGIFHINLTDQPDEEVANWARKISRELDNDFFNRKLKYKHKFIKELMRLIALIELHHRKKTLFSVLRLRVKNFFKRHKVGKNQKAGICFRKKITIDVERFINKNSYFNVDNEVSLKRINKKLNEIVT
ncbi:MAG: B12-binding domain-containing radical SAM protein [Candidatus Omnitrophica bacterium]|nr:B12-binding domain-containing radical SAM protein [Candidatus Omnitrophota bacterium]